MNRNIEYFKRGYKEAYANWNLTEEQLEKAVKVLSKYFVITKPESKMQCLHIEDQ